MESERKIEKERIEMAVQSNLLDPQDPQVIQKIIIKLEEWYGKSNLDSGTTSWRELNGIKRKDGEDVSLYLNRFDAANANLKCTTPTSLPDEILTIMILDGLNVDSIQRQNIVSKIQFDNN